MKLNSHPYLNPWPPQKSSISNPAVNIPAKTCEHLHVIHVLWITFVYGLNNSDSCKVQIHSKELKKLKNKIETPIFKKRNEWFRYDRTRWLTPQGIYNKVGDQSWIKLLSKVFENEHQIAEYIIKLYASCSFIWRGLSKTSTQ